MNNGYRTAGGLAGYGIEGGLAIGGANSRMSEMAEKQRFAAESACQIAPTPVSETARELSRLEASVSGLHRTIEELIGRLHPVTMPTPAESTGNGGSEPTCGSPIASHVQAVRCGVESATARLNVLLGSLAI